MGRILPENQCCGVVPAVRCGAVRCDNHQIIRRHLHKPRLEVHSVRDVQHAPRGGPGPGRSALQAVRRAFVSAAVVAVVVVVVVMVVVVDDV